MFRFRTRFLLVVAMLFSVASFSFAEESEVSTGPLTVGIHGGSHDGSGFGGIDARLDYLTEPVQVHLFGTYELLDAGSRWGRVDNQRYGAGLAVSHSYGDEANAFLGGSVINEYGENFSQVYLGGKLKVSDGMFLAGSYGFGLTKKKTLDEMPGLRYRGEAVDWAKLGVALAPANNWRAEAHVFVDDPWDESLLGVDGELAYYLTDALSLGLRGDTHLNTKSNVERNWNAALFLEYAMGSQRGKLSDLVLAESGVVEYPRVLRSTQRMYAGPSGPALVLSPSAFHTVGCDYGTVVLTASGGVPPYTWSQMANPGDSLGQLTPNYGGNNNQALWDEDCIDGGINTVTVQDSIGQTAQSTMFSE